MKQCIGAGLMMVLAVSSAAAQESKLYSEPALPSREVLDPLKLRMAWNVHVPMDGRRDGFVSIQLHAGQLVAATRTGVVAAFDPLTGRELWKIVVGKPDENTYKPTYNARSVLIVRGVQLYAIDRKTGGLQWQYRLPFGLATAPVADERQIYISGLNSQVAAFDLPAQGAFDATPTNSNLRTGDELDSRYKKERDNLVLREVHPDVMWSARTNLKLEYTPTMTADELFFATPNGYVLLLGKYPLDNNPVEIYRYQLDNRLTAAPGIYNEMAYIPTSDTNLNAISITSGKSRWRYSAGNVITRQPFATDTDVYFTDDRKGLVRLDRDTGKPLWKLPFGRNTTEGAASVERVLAVNPKFVYGADSAGCLRVLDRATGKQLSYYEPFRTYNFPVSNETTDRLLLAANNGLIVCLHDRDYETPLIHRKYEYDNSSPETLAKKLQDKLNRKVSEKAVDALPLIDVLESFRRKYGIDIFLSDRAFIDQGMQSVRNKLVVQSRVENLEVSEVLKGVLSKVDAKYIIVGDTIHIIPAKTVVAVDKNPMVDVPPPPPMDNLDAKLRELLTKVQPTPALDKLTVDEFILQTATRFPDIKFDVDKKAFMAAGIDPEDVLKRDMVYPKGKIPFSQVLRDCLGQVKCDYEAKGDTILIVPKK